MTPDGTSSPKATRLSPCRKSYRPPPVPPEAHVSTEGRLTLSVAEAAKELGICSRNVYNLCHRADFPTVRIGQRVRISRAGLAEWVRAQEQNRARA